MREGKSTERWERTEDREEKETERSHKTRRRMKCASSEGQWLCYPSPCGGFSSSCAMPSFKVGEELAIHTALSFFLPQQNWPEVTLPLWSTFQTIRTSKKS